MLPAEFPANHFSPFLSFRYSLELWIGSLFFISVSQRLAGYPKWWAALDCENLGSWRPLCPPFPSPAVPWCWATRSPFLLPVPFYCEDLNKIRQSGVHKERSWAPKWRAWVTCTIHHYAENQSPFNKTKLLIIFHDAARAAVEQRWRVASLHNHAWVPAFRVRHQF